MLREVIDFKSDPEACVEEFAPRIYEPEPDDDWLPGWWIAPMFVAGVLFYVFLLYWIFG